jgi:hypothetical protein
LCSCGLLIDGVRVIRNLLGDKFNEQYVNTRVVYIMASISLIYMMTQIVNLFFKVTEPEINIIVNLLVLVFQNTCFIFLFSHLLAKLKSENIKMIQKECDELFDSSAENSTI